MKKLFSLIVLLAGCQSQHAPSDPVLTETSANRIYSVAIDGHERVAILRISRSGAPIFTVILVRNRNGICEEATGSIEIKDESAALYSTQMISNSFYSERDPNVFLPTAWKASLRCSLIPSDGPVLEFRTMRKSLINEGVWIERDPKLAWGYEMIPDFLRIGSDHAWINLEDGLKTVFSTETGEFAGVGISSTDHQEAAAIFSTESDFKIGSMNYQLALGIQDWDARRVDYEHDHVIGEIGDDPNFGVTASQNQIAELLKTIGAIKGGRF